jgi:acetylglutamate kinase
VDGLMDVDGTVISALGTSQAATLRAEEVLMGGMIPKVDACFRAAEVGAEAYIANGTLPGTVRALFSGERPGTRVGGN